MSFEVIVTQPFERKLKRMAKKYKSLSVDLAFLVDELAENATIGTPIGKECYKIRLAVASKGKGKRGGIRLITYVRVIKNKVYLLDIYDKSEQATITDSELKLLINILADQP